MTTSLFLPAITLAEPERIEVRSDINRALLGTIGMQGLYYWERRANSLHLLTWERLIELPQARQALERALQAKDEQATGMVS